MYLEYFGLSENPFSITPDPQFRYHGRREREAMAHLQYGLRANGGFVQLTGEVGTGKTMLIRALLEELPDDVVVALILNPVMTVQEFVAAICDELWIKYPKNTNSLKVLVDMLNQYLLQNYAKGRRTVLIMDEAQNLSREVLEQVRLLTNLETSKHKLLQIILVGQQELDEKLARHDMRQLAQRITARYTLDALSRRETREYIAHRCKVAGAKHTLFTRSAMNWVYRLARGNPRMTNIICDRALLGAYSDNVPLADSRTVRRAAQEVGSSVPGRFWRRNLIMATSATTTVGLLVALILWFGIEQMDSPESGPVETAAAPVDSATLSDKVQELPERPLVQESLLPVAPVAEVVLNPRLDTLLLDSSAATDTATAFRQLFALWGLDKTIEEGQTGCDIATSEGLACIFNTGTWNNLRTYNRPAVIELVDKDGARHHVLLTSLEADNATLNVGGKQYIFPLTAISPYWYGKYLLMWRPQSRVEGILRTGTHGASVIWLREALAHYLGRPLENQSDVFDETLESQVRLFQKENNLVPDGVVGQITLMRLNNYVLDNKPPVLMQGNTARVSD
ncbi:MAG: AAA family ATPase [Gammaproteobacteria bacterium]|nr:AAA family ATPase [Gammaproteobacteria bacterium]